MATNSWSFECLPCGKAKSSDISICIFIWIYDYLFGYINMYLYMNLWLFVLVWIVLHGCIDHPTSVFFSCYSYLLNVLILKRLIQNVQMSPFYHLGHWLLVHMVAHLKIHYGIMKAQIQRFLNNLKTICYSFLILY